MADMPRTNHEPDVSVIIGAYEAMPYLIRCLESVEAQTIGAGRLEIVAVDDGSTDGTGSTWRSSPPARRFPHASSARPIPAAPAARGTSA